MGRLPHKRSKSGKAIAQECLPRLEQDLKLELVRFLGVRGAFCNSVLVSLVWHFSVHGRPGAQGLQLPSEGVERGQ